MLVTGTLNLAAAANWAHSQTRRVYLECDTSAGVVTINLPSISTITPLNARGVQIVITDLDQNALANNITINAAAAPTQDKIEGANSLVLNANGDSTILTVGNDGMWVIG